MDFSDFSEFIGPIILGLIAWLSNYFSKKKKPKQSSPDKLKNNDGESNKIEELIFGNLKSSTIDEKPLDEVEIVENIVTEDFEVKKEDVLLSNQKVNVKSKKITNDGKKKNSLSRLKDKLKNKNSLKEAVILKEILDRKY